MFPQDRADIFFREISRLVLATSSWSRAPITSAYQQTLGSLRLVRFSRSLGRVEARRLYGSEKRAEGFCVRCKGGAVGSPRYVSVCVWQKRNHLSMLAENAKQAPGFRDFFFTLCLVRENTSVGCDFLCEFRASLSDEFLVISRTPFGCFSISAAYFLWPRACSSGRSSN